MQAVVLAAGRGSRLGHYTDALPKPLLAVGDRTLLARQLDQLAQVGVTDAVIAVGYQSERIRRECSHPAVRVHFAENPAFDTAGSGRSLVVAARTLREVGEGEPIVLTHGDIVYDDRVLLRCLEGDRATTTAADRSWKSETGDEVLITSRAGRALRIAKGDPAGSFDDLGQFIGVSVLSADFARAFFEFASRALELDPSLDYETHLLSAFLERGADCAVSYTDHVPWRNVNYEEDLLRAREIFGSSAC